MQEDYIYLDHSATTPTDPRVVAAMSPYWTEIYGNPSSGHKAGKAAKAAIAQARENIAAVLNCAESEIVFTSGGTESNNLALHGIAQAQQTRGRGQHIITTATEHHAILDVVHELGAQGFEVTVLPVDAYGRVTPEQVAAALREDTILVSVIYANNEVGTVNPIAEIGAAIKAANRRTRFHVDAVQAPGLLPLDVQALNVDAMSLSGHKFYGPKGAGLLYVRRGLPLTPQILGGGQQGHRRSGTEAVPLIVGLAEALKLAEAERSTTVAHLRSLRETFIERITQTLPMLQLTGHPNERLPGHASFVLCGVNGEVILQDLDAVGFGASGGSACSTGQQEASHVLAAMGIDSDCIMGQMRFVFGKSNTQAHIDALLDQLPAIVARHLAQQPTGV